MGCIQLTLFLFPEAGLIMGQTGGQNTYQFLNLVTSARIAAVGGNYLPMKDDDNSIVFQNPASSNESMHKHLGLSFSNYLADIIYGYTTYSYFNRKLGILTGGIHYINYGKFTEANEYGQITGSFNANEFALVANTSRLWKEKYRLGLNSKIIYSQIADATSFGISLDAGALYEVPGKNLILGAVLRNVGYQIKKYTSPSAREPVPFEIQLGLSQRLQHLPLRIIVVAHHLEHPDIIAQDINKYAVKDTTFRMIFKKGMDQTFRHLNFGGEFTIAKALFLRFGYNHLRRQELKFENKMGMAGYSLGFGIKIAGYIFDYAFASYNVAGTTSYFSLRFPLERKKKMEGMTQ